MDKKKLKLLAVLSALCLFCVLSEAYLRGYIKPGVKQASQNKTITDSSQNKNAMDSSSSAGNNSSKNAQKSTKEPAGIKKASSGKKIQILDPVRAADSQKVRVLVMTSGFKSYYHSSVSLTCGGSFTVSDGKNVKKYSAGKKAIFNMYGKKAKPDRKKKYIIRPSGSARIKMLSIKRQDRQPLYRGTIEVKWTKQGFLVTNELPVEYYLYAVVPSEMSTSNNMEALKAQAVCARSYAYNQINAKRYKEYNADLDDSVSCQVYNNIPEDKRSRMAVDSTYGQVITNKGRIIVAYYFSTSWGCTADGQDVWNTTAEVPYLMSSLQIRKKNAAEQAEVDLSDENTFRDFINSGSYKTYDSNDDWYRWSITFNAANLSSRIDSALYNCYLLDKSLVLVQNSKGKYEQKPLKSIGTIKKLRIEKREESGLVTELVIIGTGNVVKVCTQYNIRKVLAPVYEKIKRKSGESVSSYSMLPSAAFYIDTVKTKKGTSFKISGGGFGHGAGLSQSGAAAMAEAGEDYTVIIKHFFKSTKVQDVQKVLKG
ncbi:MAG: SpoIID/LytB domain-containing protein [Lachnospiraceae bacterium]